MMLSREARRRFQSRGVGMLLIISLVCANARAQAIDPKIKIPPPEDFELKDKNGLPLAKNDVFIKVTYYPGLLKEKTLPIIMLHGYKGNRTEYAELAKYLQKEQGYAVLVPDLRGHGESTKVAGKTKPLELEKLLPNDFDAMVDKDVEGCKKFLLEKNNAGELNIEKLCIVGAEMGAVVGLNYAIQDWKWPPLVTGKQGQDVRALVLLSPLYNVERGRLNMQEPLSSPLQSNLSICILYGGEKAKPPYVRDATRIDNALKRWHKDSDEEDPTKITADLKTSLQGTKLLGVPELRVNEIVAAFIKKRVAGQDHPWHERTGPLP